MSTYGLQTLSSTGRPVDVSADGAPEYKTRGGTIDWGTVAAVGADTVLADEQTVKNGDKYLRFGQILTRIGVAEIQTVTFTGAPSAGNAILTLPAVAGQEAGAQSSVAVPYNATGAAVQAALQTLSRIGPGNVQVARTGAGTAGDPYVYTATFNRVLGNVPQFTATHSFTGGTSPSVTVATSTPGVGDGKFGPYDPAANDGRQTLSRGDCFILSRTVLASELGSDHPAFYEGGRMWKARVLATYGAASLAAGPTFTNLEAAMPRVNWAE